MIQIYMCTNDNYRANDFYSQILLFISSISILTLKHIKKEATVSNSQPKVHSVDVYRYLFMIII